MRRAAAGLILLAACGAALWRSTVSPADSTLIVPFPFGVLKRDPTLLNPRDTASTWEYYLLENLAVGLLRDDIADPRGYAPGLARSWSQPTADTWTFELRPGLKWSDGSPMQPAEIAAYYEKLAASPSRHIVHLRTLKAIAVDAGKNQLSFRFAGPMGRGLLHELSLADAAYLHPSNLTAGWAVGSGPYVVAAYDPAAMKLSLKRNPESLPIFGADGPAAVELFWTKDADFRAFFAVHGAHLFTSGAFSYRAKVTALDELVAQRLPGQPTVIYYLEVDLADPHARDPAYRQAFAAFVRKAMATAHLPAVMRPEEQMVPLGYHGRLASTASLYAGADAARLAGSKIKLSLFPQMAELDPLFKALAQQAAAAGFELTYEFDLGSGKPAFARANVFKGNQRDASGTWSFLLSAPAGALPSLRPEVAADLDTMLAADDAARLEASRRVHERVLQSALVVPLAREYTPVYAQKSVDLSRWNPFDMRLRFYDVRWR